jgi:hypothetical protein
MNLDEIVRREKAALEARQHPRQPPAVPPVLPPRDGKYRLLVSAGGIIVATR